MTATVRSAQIPKVGGELRLVDLPPVQVGPDQVRDSVYACRTLNAGDCVFSGRRAGQRDQPRRAR